MVVRALGWRAHAALVASDGHVAPLAPAAGAGYATAAGELVWIGPPGSPLHGRSVLVDDAPAVRGRLLVDGVVPWRPRAVRWAVEPGALARLLQGALARLGPPRGLGRLLGPREDDDAVVRRARPWARTLATACARGDVASLADAVRPLLGLGDGLTPAGDDFAGGVLFARRLVTRGDAGGLDATVARIVADAAALTHPVSARLLADLAAGEGWVPLHDLAAALAAQDASAVATAARGVAALGHSSGWSLHAGIMIGLGVPPNP